MSISIYLTNLKKYNEGMLVGKWLDLPADEDEIKEALEEVLSNDEEYFITDYESPFEIGEYESIFTVNDEAKEYEYILHDKFYDNEKALQVALEEYDSNIFNYRTVDVYIYSGTMEDVAREYLNECYVIPSEVADYIDYEAYGENLYEDGGYYPYDGGVVQIVG